MTLAEALGVGRGDSVALVGGGGKSTAMFRLAREVVATGGRAITTTTTKIFAGQIALSPAHVPAAAATRAAVVAALDAQGQVLVIGEADPASGKADGIPLDLFARLREWFPDACMLNEADGSRMLPFKAPADHEPVIPRSTTLVVPVVGADVLGQPLDAEHVHRPERVAALTGARPGAAITPEIVAGVLAHDDGGCKGVPADARVVALVNKVEVLADRAPAQETARLLLRHRRIETVVLAAVRARQPVLEVCRR
jgi:molybdenum cofactor cytidylyltransferase